MLKSLFVYKFNYLYFNIKDYKNKVVLLFYEESYIAISIT